MNVIRSLSIQTAITLIVSAVLISDCSGSGNSQSPDTVPTIDVTNTIPEDAKVEAEVGNAEVIDAAPTNINGDSTAGTNGVVQDTSVDEMEGHSGLEQKLRRQMGHKSTVPVKQMDGLAQGTNPTQHPTQ